MTFRGDPVEAMEGILSEIDIDSVTLQHRVKDLWVSKVLTDVPD